MEQEDKTNEELKYSLNRRTFGENLKRVFFSDFPKYGGILLGIGGVTGNEILIPFGLAAYVLGSQYGRVSDEQININNLKTLEKRLKESK